MIRAANLRNTISATMCPLSASMRQRGTLRCHGIACRERSCWHCCSRSFATRGSACVSTRSRHRRCSHPPRQTGSGDIQSPRRNLHERNRTHHKDLGRFPHPQHAVQHGAGPAGRGRASTPQLTGSKANSNATPPNVAAASKWRAMSSPKRRKTASPNPQP